MRNELDQLRSRMAEITDLRNTAHLLEWDQQTMMPPRGGASRAESIATLERIRHDMFVSAETGRLLDAAAGELDGADSASDDAALVRVVRRRWDKARRVPTELAAEIARAGSIGQEAWVRARANNDFDAFAPYLTRNLELARRYVDCFDTFDCPYDVLLDDFDPGMATADVTRLFDELKAALVPVIGEVAQHADRVDDGPLHGTFPVERQRQLVFEVVERMGFDRAGWRIDDAVHPFATGLGSQDVRITTRWDEHFFASALFSAMHECGHGLYEAGIDSSLQRTPLGSGESLSVHESQSRMWENMVGRGRAFSGVLAPRIAELFGGSVADLDATSLYRAVNRVEPSHIRVEADEATYGLHIVLRFELEQEMIEGRLPVAEVPEAWDARFKEYFGLEVPDPAHGALQDVHWSAGLIGYFPTYALGNLIAGQLWEKAHADMPDLEAAIGAGELSGLREWLRENVHRHGAKFSTPELLQRVVGHPIEVAPFVRYLRAKLSDVYELDLP
ncbi:MAG: carboxypeptidase M32 [Solirubrobacterales bacterium]|nr:carboxypeptidase M32 [Solirubrobacterales bacterium]